MGEPAAPAGVYRLAALSGIGMPARRSGERADPLIAAADSSRPLPDYLLGIAKAHLAMQDPSPKWERARIDRR